MSAPLATKRGTVRESMRRMPQRWTLFQAVRCLERDDKVAHVAFATHAARHEIEAFEIPRRGPVTVRATGAAFGPFGSALEMTQRRANDAISEAIGDAHRLLRAAWERGRPEVVWERDSRRGTQNTFETDLLALGGIDTREIDALPRDAVASISGLLLRGSGLDLAQACNEIFSVPLRIGDAKKIGGVRLWVGPLTWRQYQAFLTDAESAPMRGLLQLAALYFGPAVFEIVLVLHRDEVPRCKAGMPSACPGETAWLFAGPTPRRHVLTRLDAEHCRHVLQPETKP